MSKTKSDNEGQEVHPLVKQTKQFRKDLDQVLENIKTLSDPTDPATPFRSSQERLLAITKIREAIMWLGMDLKALREEGIGGENPYPQSYNPDSPNIEPPADDLKL